MDAPPDTKPSSSIVDRRSATSHGVAGLLGVLIGAIFGRATGGASDLDRDLVALTSVAIDRGQEFWASAIGPSWRTAHVVLIDSPESTPCGTADQRSGPFYCPANERIYLDLAFLRAIDGELARAYVIAHELGHHVQAIRGERGASVSVELEADCYAGQWMSSEAAHGHLAPGDFAAAIAEAAAVGDDRIRPDSSPETWTHGSSAQRVAALSGGFGGSTCALR
jgi:predicted metalloprotease